MRATKRGSRPRADLAEQHGDRRYVLEDQVGYILRQVSQRHAMIFVELIGSDITPTQWAVMAKPHEVGPTSQNLLGRLTSMDAATIKGVVDRLAKRHLVESLADATDSRRLIIGLTDEGVQLVNKLLPTAHRITEVTLSPLSASERVELLKLLGKMR